MKKYLLLAFPFLATIASAQFSNNPAVNAIVRDSAGIEEAVPICGLNPLFGKTFVSWFNQNGSGSYDFSMNTMDGNGNLLLSSSGFTVSNYPQNSAIYVYDTKVDHTNAMVTAFQDERSGQLDVVAYRMDSAGNFMYGNAGVTLFDSAATGGIAPHVGILAANDAVIAWIAQGSPKSWISFQRLTPSGSRVWSSVHRIIDSTNTVSYSRPQIVPMKNEDFFLLYIRQSGSFFPPVSTMFMQRYNSAGNAVWPSPVQISSKTIGFASYPSVVPDENNGAYIAFATSNPVVSSFNDVYVQHIDENGTLWSVDGTEACTSSTTQRMSPTIRFENGMIHPMVLIKETDGAQGSAGVTVQSFDSTGNRLLGPNGFSVTPITAAYDEAYDMRSSGNGMIIIYAEGGFGNNQLFATKIDFTGAPMWTPITLSVSTVASNKLRVQLTPVFGVAGSEQTIAVWEDERIGRGVYTQNINVDGTLGITTNILNPFYNKTDISIYPNPSASNQFLRIVSDETEFILISLYDATGRLLATSKNNELLDGVNQFSLSTIFPNTKIIAGIYSVSINGKNRSNRIQFVKEG